MKSLPYRKPTEGRDYWVLDDVLPDPGAVRTRSLYTTTSMHRVATMLSAAAVGAGVVIASRRWR